MTVSLGKALHLTCFGRMSLYFKSLWIRASAKLLNVNVANTTAKPGKLELTTAYLHTTQF